MSVEQRLDKVSLPLLLMEWPLNENRQSADWALLGTSGKNSSGEKPTGPRYPTGPERTQRESVLHHARSLLRSDLVCLAEAADTELPDDSGASSIRLRLQRAFQRPVRPLDGETAWLVIRGLIGMARVELNGLELVCGDDPVAAGEPFAAARVLEWSLPISELWQPRNRLELLLAPERVAIAAAEATGQNAECEGQPIGVCGISAGVGIEFRAAAG